MELTESKIAERATDLERFWQPRNQKCLDERAFIRLEQPKTVKKGFVNVRYNEARTLWDTSVALLSGFDPTFHLPAFGEGDEEKSKKNKGERFLTGVYRQNDRAMLDMGQDRWLWQLAWYIIGGWYAVFPHIDIDRKNNLIFEWDIYDPLTVYPRWAGRELVEIARVYYTNRETAYSMAKANDWELPTYTDSMLSPLIDNTKITNYWTIDDESVWNTVLIDDKFAKLPTEETDFDRIPIIVGAVGGTPGSSFDINSQSWVERAGASVIEGNRGMLEQLDRWLSLLMQIVQDAALPPTVQRTRSGMPKIKKEDLGSGALLTQQLGEQLEQFRAVGSPVEVNSLLNFIFQGVGKGGLPSIVYGSPPYGESGFHASMLFGGVQRKLGIYMWALQRVVAECSIATMRLYRKGGYKPIELVVESAQGENFIESFNPKKDLPDATFVKVDIPFSLPLDKIQTIVAARQAIQEPQVISLETLWETWDLGVKDKELEYERMLNDRIMRDPVMQGISIVEKMRERADFEEGQGHVGIANKIREYADMKEAQIVSMVEGATQEGQQLGAPVGGRFAPERFGRSRAQERANMGVPPPSPTRLPAERGGLPLETGGV